MRLRGRKLKAGCRSGCQSGYWWLEQRLKANVWWLQNGWWAVGTGKSGRGETNCHPEGGGGLPRFKRAAGRPGGGGGGAGVGSATCSPQTSATRTAHPPAALPIPPTLSIPHTSATLLHISPGNPLHSPSSTAHLTPLDSQDLRFITLVKVRNPESKTLSVKAKERLRQKLKRKQNPRMNVKALTAADAGAGTKKRKKKVLADTKARRQKIVAAKRKMAAEDSDEDEIL